MVSSCTKVYTQPSDNTTTTTIIQVPTADTIEFRVFGSNPFGPIQVKHIDPLNGLTLTTTSLPYFASVQSRESSDFLFLEASGFGASNTSTLQVQIFVNGKLFREAGSIGLNLFASASGTFRR